MCLFGTSLMNFDRLAISYSYLFHNYAYLFDLFAIRAFGFEMFFNLQGIFILQHKFFSFGIYECRPSCRLRANTFQIGIFANSLSYLSIIRTSHSSHLFVSALQGTSAQSFNCTRPCPSRILSTVHLQFVCTFLPAFIFHYSAGVTYHILLAILCFWVSSA